MPARYELKKSNDGQFVFNLKAGNGEVILTSERYKDKSSAMNGIASVQKNGANDAMYEKKTSTKGDPYFVLKAGNNEIIGRSEMYSSDSARNNGIESVKKNCSTQTIADLTI